MIPRTRLQILAVSLASSCFVSTALAGGIARVAVYPTCAITPDDPVTLEVFIITGGSAAFLYRPTEVTISGSHVSVEVFVDSGMLPALDSVLVSAQVGPLPAGHYSYAVYLHYPGAGDYTPPPQTGSFSVVHRPCMGTQGHPDMMYWADSFGNIKRATRDGARVESLSGTLQDPGSLVVMADAGEMYWIERNPCSIRRADLDGRNVVELVSCETTFAGMLRLDPDHDEMYWIENAGLGSEIMRANLDGSEVELLLSGYGSVRDLVLDVSRRKLFWASMMWISPGQLTGAIYAADTDASVVTELASGLGHLRDLSLDASGEWLYWTEFVSGENKIRRAKVDGTQLEDLVELGLCHPLELVVESEGGKFYWIDQCDDIARADLDGGNIEELVLGCRTMSDLVLDAANRKMYWTHRSGGQTHLRGMILRSDLDGRNIEELVTNLGSPSGLALTAGRGNMPELRRRPSFSKSSDPKLDMSPP